MTKESQPDRVLAEAANLYALGFAIHWLRPRSKIPVRKGWTQGPRAEWAEIEASYQPGFNLGIRLGSPSKIDGMYLAYIDCDVKSTDPRHQREMLAALDGLFPGFSTARTPRVKTGSGKGSMHILILTKTPIEGRCLARSREMVKVRMPSVEPSRRERETMLPEDIEAGFRMRTPWEICSMGEGRQVVAPPSVHPDTGDIYTWLVTPTDGPVPILDEETLKRISGESAPLRKPDLRLVKPGDFIPKEVDDDELRKCLGDETYTVLRDGHHDGSEGIYFVAGAMFKAGYSIQEIATVLTDREYDLGNVAYRHASTDDRSKAAAWLEKYTITRARANFDPTVIFEEIAGDTAPEISGADVTAELEFFSHPDDWKNSLERMSKSLKPINTRKNIELVLSNAFPQPLFRKNTFANTVVLGLDTPWGAAGEEISDIHLARMTYWFSKYRFEPGRDTLCDAIVEMSERFPFHPVREYLSALRWDGTPRLRSWLKIFCSAEAPEPYLSEISVKTLIGAVRRAYEPGCQFDQMLVMEGAQGIRKSTTVRVLGGEWYSDVSILASGRDKDTVLNMQGVWIHELGELSAVKHADVEVLKDFLSKRSDKIRVPFSRLPVTFKRQGIQIGTVNSDRYLKDRTGNRRFWPVRVGHCDTGGLEAIRDQLWAEAVWCYELGETTTLSAAAATQAVDEQENRTFSDETWEALVEAAIDRQRYVKPENQDFDPDKITMADLFDPVTGAIRKPSPTKEDEHRMGDCLRKLGYERKRASDKSRKKYWKLKS